MKHSVLVGCFLFYPLLLIGQDSPNFMHIVPTYNGKTIAPFVSVEGFLGQIWMAQSSGVYVYNGYNFILTPTHKVFPGTKRGDGIKKMMLDHNKNIWFLSYQGMVSRRNTAGRFEEIIPPLKTRISTIHTTANGIWLSTNKGTIYRYGESKIDSVTTIDGVDANLTEIQSIALSSSNELYVSTNNGKVFVYALNTGEIGEVRGPFTDYPGSLVITFDKKGHLWIGTENFGLYVYAPESRQFIEDSIFSSNRYNITNELFLVLYCDSKGVIWGGTDGGGLYKVNPDDGQIQLFTHHANNRFSLSSNTIIDINEDSHNNMWILTNYGNINILPNLDSNVAYHEGSASNTPSRVLSVHKDLNGELWIGTDGSGLTRVITSADGTATETQYFDHDGLNKGFYVQSIAEDVRSNIWFGTYKNGLWHYDLQKDKFKHIPILNSKQQVATDVRTIFRDSKQRLWVGSNISLNVYSSDRKMLASFENNTHGLKGPILESMIEDEKGNLWLGYFKGGLFEFNEDPGVLQNSSFTRHTYCDEKAEYNKTYGIKSMAADGHGTLWLIDSQSKLSKFQTADKTYDLSELLDNTFAQSILVENKYNIWISTSNGLVHLNDKDSVIKTYYKTDGFQNDFFLPRSAFKDQKGLLYFGGVKGLNYFDPKKIHKKESSARLHINDIEILNRPARSLIPDQINSGVYNADDLKLKFDQSSFSFRFSAIDNILSSNYFYAYRLKGFNDEWIPTQTTRVATYTNIPPGSYTFQVRAGSKKGIWDIPAKSIVIEIAQPWWNNPLAHLLYLFVLGLLAYAVKRWYSIRKKLFAEKISHKKENELYELKMNFFAKMSHEVQTPITLILGPIEDMLKRAENDGNLLLKQRLDIISNNVKRLSKIARELTTIRNRELGRLRLLVTKNNLYEDLKNIALSFKEQARFKHIDFLSNCPKNLTEAWYDRDKIEHVIYNLLSNAFKFTPEEGYIQLNAVPVNSKNSIKISITDSGPGIAKEELENIFTLFYQSDTGKRTKGTGIGLALTKELIDLHRGKIEVNSTSDEGTTITVTLPIGEDAYAESERIMTGHNAVGMAAVEQQAPVQSGVQEEHKKTVLVVEDNYELQAFLKNLLSDRYNVILAENGEVGFYYAKSNVPDLILSDIMMPKMDGVEMCKLLQKDHLTKHIPVILLTAKNSTNSKISGLKSGAIEYINKPFNTHELLLKIYNIIASREHIISKYKKEVIGRPEVKMEKSQEDVFLENLVSAINSRIEDANFKMEELADTLHMSYSSLYRRCQALTGHSLIDFVRLLRLKKAAVVIAKYGYNISEAAFMVGFNDPKYFSKCFKKQFGRTPNSFKKEAHEIGTVNYLRKHNLEGII